jgi:methylase of polypeptide subunit release factors
MVAVPPSPIDSRALDNVRTALERNEYSASKLHSFLTDVVVATFADGWSNPARRRTDRGSGLETLARLFALGFDVPTEELNSVSGARLADWVETGLVRVSRGTARPQVAIQSVALDERQLFVASDHRPLRSGRPSFPEFVMPIGDYSLLLSGLVLREPIRCALDLGTGSGVQAMLAASHCEEVVATDVNPRALAFARFNLALNSITNVELRHGDLYDSVTAEQFGLVVSNPPFAISPSNAYLFRDSPRAVDGMSAAVVRGAAGHLTDGGWAYVLCDWVQTEAMRWQTRVARWVDGAGCDAMAVQLKFRDPVAYAIEWLRDIGQVNPDAADRDFEAWLGYYEREGITGIGSGFVVLRKTDHRTPWFATHELSEQMIAYRGSAIASAFAAQDWLRDQRARELIDQPLRIADSVRAEPNFVASDGGWIQDGTTLRQVNSLQSSIRLNQAAYELIASCDGRRPLGRLLDEQLFDGGVVLSSTDSRFRRAHDEAEDLVRHLVATGFLVPGGGEGDEREIGE